MTKLATDRNFKRMQREVRKDTRKEGLGTKAQQAMKLQMALNKKECQARSREKRGEKKVLVLKLRQAKKKEKHRGH